MITNMSFLKNSSNARFILPALLTLSIPGCGGGMVGTGTGPVNDVYALQSLPERISPDVPKTLLKGAEQYPAQEQNNSAYENEMAQRNNQANQSTSEGWEELTGQYDFVAYARLLAESNSTIVDLAFEDILGECAERLIDCIIPSGKIRVKMTQDVVNRLIKLHMGWLESASSTSQFVPSGGDVEALIKSEFTALLNTEIVLGEIRYSQLARTPYDHTLQTTMTTSAIRDSVENDYTPLVNWNGEFFDARWTEVGDVAKFSTNYEDRYILNYFYQNNAPGEFAVATVIPIRAEEASRVNFSKLIGNDSDNAGILLEFVSVGTASFSDSNNDPADSDQGVDIVPTQDYTVVNSTDAVNSETDTDAEPPLSGASVSAPLVPRQEYLSYITYQAKMDNDGGYSSHKLSIGGKDDFSSLVNIEATRDSFDRIGTLIAGQRCQAFEIGDDCSEDEFSLYGPDGSQITDSVHYFKSEEEFDSLVAMQDSVRWEVRGLPTDIQTIAVVSADSAFPLAQRDVYCRGLQYVSEDVRLFCSATDEQLDSSVIVELVDGRPDRLIPEASLMQKQLR